MADYDIDNLVVRVREILGEDQNIAAYWDDTYIEGWLNDAMRHFATRAPTDLLQELTNITTADFPTASTWDIPSGTLRIVLVRVKYPTDSSFITARLVDPMYHYLGRKNPATEDTPVWYAWDNDVYIDPAPGSQVTDGLQVWTVDTPAVQTGSGYLEIDNAYMTIMMDYAICEGFRRSNDARADFYGQRFERVLQELSQRYFRETKTDQSGRGVRG